MTPATRRTRRLPIPAAACALALAGCAANAPGPNAHAPPTPDQDAAASPVVHADRGLELRWWVVADDNARLARALAPYASRPTPADPEARRRWQRSGLRIVAVPLEDLTALRDALPKVGATNRQWIGQSPTWLDALAGPALNRATTLVVDDATATFDPGQLRMMVRAWLVPRMTDAGARAALHLELVPQHRARAAASRTLDERLMPAAPAHRTRMIESLRLTLNAGPGQAILVVPERPGVRWDDAPPPDDQRDPADGLGPHGPTYPTLGSAMLTDSPAGLGASVRKAVIVLIPRVPDRFELAAR